MPLREALAFVYDALTGFDLKKHIRIIASGKVATGFDLVKNFALGADMCNSARGMMFALGCIQALQCNKNTCPTGITSHDKKLQTGLDPEDKAVRVMHYAKNMMKEVWVIAHSCGVREPRQLKRHHARIVTDNGLSIPLSQLHPEAVKKH